MSVRGSKRGKSSHEQKPVGSAGGDLFGKAAKGITPVRGAAGGLLFLKPAGRGRKHKQARPSFEHAARSGRHSR